ncbi:MAG: DUF356 domain-containing protein [Candidatus Methanoperedens sp.]|nr:DUF356 domain-containing protein [Candidatus Methanoperedens sp.]
MRSIAIIRAADILKLRSTLMEMNRTGIDFEGKPKEINPGAVEKILSRTAGASDKNCEFCALVPLTQDYESSRSKMKSMVIYSDVLILDSSQELFENFARLIPVLPDLVLPNVLYKDTDKQTGTSKEKPSAVYLGVFINRKVQVQTGSGTIYTGILRHADSIGVFFEPSDNSSPLFITWHDIKKVIIPKEDK